jgi:antitoxin Phd
MTEWQLQEAKNKFSEVINRALTEGPQEITRRGQKVAVVLSYEDYSAMQRKDVPLVQFFRDSPLQYVTLERHKDYPRGTDL